MVVLCCGCWVLVAVSLWLQCIAIWENPESSWESNKQPAAPVAKGKGLLDVCMLEEAGGINLCCFLRPLQFSKYFVFSWVNHILKWPQNPWTQDVLKTMQKKIPVYYCIHYFTGVKVATSSLSEGRDCPTLGSLSHIAFASGRRPMWNILLSSVFPLNVWGLLRAAAHL